MKIVPFKKEDEAAAKSPTFKCGNLEYHLKIVDYDEYCIKITYFEAYVCTKEDKEQYGYHVEQMLSPILSRTVRFNRWLVPLPFLRWRIIRSVRGMQKVLSSSWEERKVVNEALSAAHF